MKQGYLKHGYAMVMVFVRDIPVINSIYGLKVLLSVYIFCVEKGPSSFIWCRMCCIKKEKPEDPHITQHVKYYGRMSDSGSSNIELSTVAQQGEKHS